MKVLGVICCGVIALKENFAIAQIIPDTTLPNNSSIQSINNSKIINGGTQAGSNLFHSFEEFSIPIGTSAYFNNTLDIQNIISRVTGSKVSNIDGVIKANGAANLFFINPNGIIFGNNAELNIGGSFIASTASSLNFADGSKFSATDTKPQEVLKVSVSEGLQFGKTANPIYLTSQASPDSKTNSLGYPVGLQVSIGKTLALVGGLVILNGGNLTAPGGRIELLSVGNDSLLSLHSSLASWVFGYNGNTVSSLSTSTQGSGNAGNLELNTQQLIVRDRAEVNVSSEAAKNFIYSSSDVNSIGSAGALKVQARSIILDNQGKLISEADFGRGGNINLLLSDLLLMRRGSQISASAGKLDTPGDGGNINIDIPTGFIVAPPQENNDITANAFSGSGGKVQINAISLFGVAPLSREDLARQLGVDGTNPSLLDPSRLSTSDITAISQENPTLNGAVNINTLDNNINRIPVTLPTQPLVSKVVTSCRPDVVRGISQFVITGRGGLPATPIDPIRSNTILEPDWVSVQRNNSRHSQDWTNARAREINVGSQKSYPEEIVEAQGLMRFKNGDLYLVANVPVTTNYNPWFNKGECVVPN